MTMKSAASVPPPGPGGATDARHHRPRRVFGVAVAATALALAAGCATGSYGPPPSVVGMPIAEAQRLMGPPTGSYRMPDGSTRVEFARGPYGKHTWMLDLDAQGRVVRAEQVLGPENFMKLRPGMPRDDVLRLLGRPSEARRGGWQGGEIWSWRYPTNDCLWYEAAIVGGQVRDSGYGPDPRCDPPTVWGR